MVDVEELRTPLWLTSDYRAREEVMVGPHPETTVCASELYSGTGEKHRAVRSHWCVYIRVYVQYAFHEHVGGSCHDNGQPLDLFNVIIILMQNHV